MSKAYVTLEGQEVLQLGKIVSATIVKDRYTPYSQLRGRVIIDGKVELGAVKRVGFYIGGKRVHYGLADLLSVRVCGGQSVLNIVSRGITILLGQNQPEPGIWSQVSLTEIMGKYSPTSEIAFEADTQKVNYVNINEGSTLWEAIGVYGTKAYGARAYIGEGDKVCVSASEKLVLFEGRVIDYGSQLDTRLMLSKVHMKNVEGNYGYSYENDEIKPFGIVREKYYNLDRQWLNDVSVGLKDRIGFSNREHNVSWLTHVGYLGEDIDDLISAVGYDVDGKRVCRVEVNLDNRGIRTKIFVEN